MKNLKKEEYKRMDEIRKEVENFIVENTGTDITEIDMQHSFEEYEIDSILLIKLIVYMEEKFSISYQEKILLEEYSTIKDFVVYTHSLLLK